MADTPPTGPTRLVSAPTNEGYTGSDTLHYFNAEAESDLSKPLETSSDYLRDQRVQTNPLTGQLTSTRSFGSTNITHLVPDPIGSYTKYGFTPNTFVGDPAELRARRQSNASKNINGLKRAGVNFAASVGENLLSLPAALYEAVDGKSKGVENLYDNPVTRVADSMREWSRESFEVYNTKAYNRMRATEKLGTGQFWANEIADGFAFSFASMATALIPSSLKFMPATRGMKIASKLANRATKAKSLKTQYELFKNLQYNRAGINTTNKIGQKLIGPKGTGAPKVSAIQEALNNTKANKFSKYTKAVEQIESATMMSMAESGIEARESRDVYVETTLAEEAERRGVAIEDLPTDVRAAIEEEGRSVGNSVFGLNLAVLSLSNSVMFSRAIKSGAGIPKGNFYNNLMSKAGFKDAAGNPIKGTLKNKLRGYPKGLAPGFGKTTMYNAYDELSFLRKALYTSGEMGKAAFKSGPVELLQENLQLQASHGVVDYHTDKHFDAGTEDVIESFTEAFEYSFGSEQGKESMLIGFIVGSIMGGVGTLSGKLKSKKTRAQEKKAIQEVMNMYNAGLMDNPHNAVSKSMYQGTIIQEMEAIQNALFGMDDIIDDVDLDTAPPNEEEEKLTVTEGTPLELKEGAEGSSTNLVTPGKGFRVGKGRKIVPGKDTAAPGTTAGQKGKYTTPEDTTEPATEEETVDPNETIPQEEWDRFINNVESGKNDISRKRAIDLGNKVKKGQKLSAREKAMYNAKEEYIDSILTERAQAQKAKEYYKANPHRAKRRLEELAFKLLQEEAIFHLERGTFDLFIRKLEDAKGLSDEEFQKAFGISKEMMESPNLPNNKYLKAESLDAKGNFQRDSQFLKEYHVDQIIKRSRKLEAQFGKIEAMYGEFERGSGLSDIEKIDEQIRYEKWWIGKQVLYRHATYLDYLDDVIDRAAEDLGTLHPEINVEELKKATVEDFFGAAFAVNEKGEPIMPEVVEKLTKEGLYEPAKYAGGLYKGYLRNVYEDILKNNPLDKKLFQQVFSEMVKLMADREEILRTFEELITSDTALEDYIEEKEGREYVGRTKRRRERALRILSTAETPQDIQHLINSGEIPEDLKADAEALMAEMRKQRNAYRNGFLKLSLDELNALDTEEFPPLKQEAYEEVVKLKEEFQKTGQTDPYVKSPEKRGKDKKGAAAEKTKKKDAESKGTTTEETGEPGEPGVDDPNFDIDDAEDIDERAEAKVAVRPDNLMGFTGTGKRRQKVLQLNEDGSAQKTVRYINTETGEPIVIKDYLLQNPDIKEERVEFVLLPVGFEQQKLIPDWHGVPIFVKLGDDIVGVLLDHAVDSQGNPVHPELSKGRLQIYGQLNRGNKVFATVKDLGLTNTYNLNNARTVSRDKDGDIIKDKGNPVYNNKVFYDPSESFGNRLDLDGSTFFQNPKAKVIIAIPTGFGSNLKLTVVDPRVSDAEKAAIESDLTIEVGNAIKQKRANYLVGQPVFVVLNPATGRYQSIIGSTQNLTDAAIAETVKALQDKNLLKVQEIVGLTYPNVNAATDTRFFGIAKFKGDPAAGEGTPIFYLDDPNVIETAEQWFKDNEEQMQIYFHSKTASGISGATSTLVKINSNNLSKALKGEDFSFVLVEPLEDAEGNVKFEASQFNAQEESTYVQEIKDNLVKDLTDLLKEKKAQVSAEKLQANQAYTSPVTGRPYNSYQEYLFSAEEMKEQGAERGQENRGGSGHLSILTTDVKNINGTIFSNPRLTFVSVSTSETATSTAESTEVSEDTVETGENATEQDMDEEANNFSGRGRSRGGETADTAETGSTTDLSDLVREETEESNPKAKLYNEFIESEVAGALNEDDLKDLQRRIEDDTVSIADFQDLLDNLDCF